MYPALPDELGEADAPLLLQLLYELEQAAVIITAACDEVGSTTQHVMAVLRSTHKRVELLAAVATADHYRLSPCLAYGVKELVY